MKTMLMASPWPLLLCALAASAASHAHGVTKSGVMEPQAEADAKEDDKEEKTLETLRIKFEIENFNYYDLTKETCPEKVKKHHKHHKKPKIVVADADKDAKGEKKADESKADESEDLSGKPPWMKNKGNDKAPPPQPPAPTADSGSLGDLGGKPPWMKNKGKEAPPPPPPAPPSRVSAAPAIDEVHQKTDQISDEIKRGMANQNAEKPPWMQKGGDGAASFLQIGRCAAHHDMGETTSMECTTIMDVLRSAIKETIQGIISCLYKESLLPAAPAPGPAAPKAAAPASASFLHVTASKVATSAPAPAAAPKAPPKPNVRIFVTFSPGRKIGSGRSTMVEVSFLDTPDNGIDDVSLAKPFLVECTTDGMFAHELELSLQDVTAITPTMVGTAMDTTQVDQWNIKKCEKHMRAIVEEFTHHYTRQQVPMALYNECTNFMTRMSFSHDYVLDRMDTKRCRRATRKFEKHWNYGKNTKEKDFQEMCLSACEAKYGLNAPLCNVNAGDGLLGQPLL